MRAADSTYIYAGHLPTRVFTQAEWLAMPIIIEELQQNYAPLTSPGPFRTTQRGRPVVFYGNWQTNEYWQVRPIVRVLMGREWIDMEQYHRR